MYDVIKSFTRDIMQQQENIIKKYAKQGHKYLSIKLETTHEGTILTTKFIYNEIDSMSDAIFEEFESQGLRIIDLEKVRLSEIETKIIAQCVGYTGYVPLCDIKRIDENTFSETLIKNDGSKNRLKLVFKLDLEGNVKINREDS